MNAVWFRSSTNSVLQPGNRERGTNSTEPWNQILVFLSRENISESDSRACKSRSSSRYYEAHATNPLEFIQKSKLRGRSVEALLQLMSRQSDIYGKGVRATLHRGVSLICNRFSINKYLQLLLIVLLLASLLLSVLLLRERRRVFCFAFL